MNAFDRYLHTVITEGAVEARRQGSATVEAQHLLLAVAAQEGTAPQRVLASAGLDHPAIVAALDREFHHSLAAVGVSRGSFGLSRTGGTSKPPALGATARLSLERAFGAASRKKDLRPAHVLLGILRGEVGTVARALALAGVDRTDLLARVQGAVTDGPE
ncbi:Clp protease N-terminal domain-containing protein [Sphaerisporangium sp. TRM90804]|uniref:Clp protease N-terminal domain-containing protein n=1 Tax=Sphaerisporangium sp. TRM90804 TaxID=3031113 RepID=UPI0024485522|nr:Clp protease N-terminal domain-containing protein [Sphaerisporangium sp. TRM90804]MDH2427010.1 Clp protease N-terminal domain-containing protein [Sphaerisporangium sp. TRM90804]